VTLDISDDEALVLYDLLADYAEHDTGRQLTIRSAAERNALWALSAALDKLLVAPFQENYKEQLAAARARVEERGGSWG
jgi:hypothetical protein